VITLYSFYSEYLNNLLNLYFILFSARDTNVKSPLEQELDRYQSMPIPDSASTEVLSWWRKNEKHLPMLAKEARKFLSIVVSSASSERTFSLAGQTVSDQRTKLDPINVDKIVTLRANLRFLKQQNPIELETEEETKEREVTFKCFKVELEVLNKN
jgi:hypothetical protein